MDWHVKKTDYYLFFLKVTLLCILFMVMNFDKSLNADYGNYLANYEHDWWQFELGFEFISYPFKLVGADFLTFWIFSLVLESVLIAILFRNNMIFLFAFPNLLFISWQHYIPSHVRADYKKKTGISIDGYGNVIKKKSNFGLFRLLVFYSTMQP